MADLGVVPLPGLMGRDLETVNRWRTSVGLEQITEEELAKVAQPVPVAGVTGQIYDLAGENPGSGDKTRILAAIVKHEGVAWFFKMNGDDEVVAEQKPAFTDFLKSVSFKSGAQSQPAAGELPPSHPPIGGAAMPTGGVPSAVAHKPHWTVPASWQETDGGPFLMAKFTVGGTGSQAAVNVSTSLGEGGGVLGNVNRWRKQLGLSEVAENDLKTVLVPLEGAGTNTVLVDMTGTDARSGQKARMIAAIVPQGEQTWFYKLMGSESIVEQEKEPFKKFVQTVDYSHEH